MYKVSVIMPIYNNENTLKQAIESILNQSIYNLELILIDDGSTDASFKISEGYAKREPLLVEVIRQNRSGFGVARNRGLLKAKGDYIYFANADVEYDYKMLEANIALAEDKAAELVVFGFRDSTQLSADGGFHHLPRMPHLSDKEEFRNHYRNFHHFFPYALHNKLYQRKYLVQNRLKFYSIPLKEAAFFNLDVYKNMSRVVFNRMSYCERIIENEEVKYQPNLFEVNLKLANYLESLVTAWDYEKEFRDLVVLEVFQAIYTEIKNLSMSSNLMSNAEKESQLETILEDEWIQQILNDRKLSKQLSAFNKGLLIALRNKNSKAAIQLVNGRKETKDTTFKLSKWLRKIVDR